MELISFPPLPHRFHSNSMLSDRGQMSNAIGDGWRHQFMHQKTNPSEEQKRIHRRRHGEITRHVQVKLGEVERLLGG